MKQLVTFFLLTLTLVSFAKEKKKCCKKKGAACVPVAVQDSILLKNRLDTISYFIGMQIGTDMAKNGSTDINPVALQDGVADALKALPSKVDPSTAMAYAQTYFSEKQIQKAAADMMKKKVFFEENAKRAEVKTTATGLQYEVLKEATGSKPLPTDIVSVHYTGTLLDGKVFDSSVGGEPATFPLNRVIPGWTEGVQLMSVGSKYKFYIPGELAYGEQGVPQAGIGSNETLIFEVELLGIQKPAPELPQVPQAPSNIKIEGQ